MKDFIVTIPAWLAIVSILSAGGLLLSSVFVEYSEQQLKQMLAAVGFALSPVFVIAVLGIVWAALSWAKLFHELANP
jgi:ABC-type polysaccharide/polyol phosphate export permease